MVAPKKSAKLATDNKGTAEHVTRRLCDHCGEPIPAKSILAVKRITMDQKGRGGSRMVYFINGHEKM